MPMNARLLRPTQNQHPEAADWANRVRTNGGSVSGSTLLAVSRFCRAIDAAGIRDRFYRLNLFCGNSDASLNAVRTPLFRGPSLSGTQFGNATDVNVNFVQGDYAETGASGGLLGNGTSKYLQTGLSPADISPAFPGCHLAAYKMTATNSGALLGSRFSHSTDASQSQAYELGGGGNIVGAIVGLNPSPGTHDSLVGAMRQSSTNAFSFRNDQKSAATTISVTPAGTPLPFAVFCRSFVVAASAPSTYSPNLYTNQRLGAYSIGAGMTDGQLAAYATAMQTFQAALSRNVA